MSNPIRTHYRLKKPCANCPFLRDRKAAIQLEPGRLQGIVESLLENDRSTFSCHKTVHGPRGGEWDDEGKYHPSGAEAMCAGAAAFLMAHGRPTVGMRLAFITGDASSTDWDAIQELVIDPADHIAQPE